MATADPETAISAHIASQPNGKRADMQRLDDLIRVLMPGCTLWFLDGRNSDGKTVTNPNIGYGTWTNRRADGTETPFYRVGLSANATGISLYIMGLADKTHLPRTYGGRLGKATVTGYCIRFKSLRDIDIALLQAAIRDGIDGPADPDTGWAATLSFGPTLR